MTNRCLFVPLPLLVAVAIALPLSAAESRRPNVLFIMADDLNCALGCYGDKVARTPNLDRLAARAVCFERAYCQYPVCNPSRTSILSGLRPDTTGITNNSIPTRTNLGDAVFLPQVFRYAGYRTIKLGKIYHAELNSGDQFEDPASWDEDLREDKTAKNPPEEQIDREYKNLASIRLKVSDGEAWDGKIARRGAQRMNELAAVGQPFFLAVGFRRPHTPYLSPRAYWDLFQDVDLRMPAEPAGHIDLIPPMARKLTDKIGRSGINDADWLLVRQAYRAAVAYMDAQVGLLLDALDDNRLWENTIVVFVSDHGYHLGEHGGHWHKGTLFEEAARVPLIVAAPNAKAGVTSSGLVELVDVYPTLTELCAVQAPSNLHGQSFTPLLEKPGLRWKPAAFTQVVRRQEELASDDVVVGRSIRTERWRYTEWDEGRAGTQLYDHATDPREFINLADDAPTAETRKELRMLLKAGWKANLPPAATNSRQKGATNGQTPVWQSR